VLRYKDITLQLLLLLITVDDKINYVIIVGLISKPSRVFFQMTIGTGFCIFGLQAQPHIMHPCICSQWHQST